MSITRPEAYRPNVGIFVLNAAGLILACERSDVANAWQIPQGGIDPEELMQNAMLRELEEEIGTRAVEILGSYPGAIRYEWPETLYSRGYRGQEQYYYLVRLDKSATLNFSSHTQEFSRSEWITSSEFLKRTNGFKADAYRKALLWFQESFPGLIAD